MLCLHLVCYLDLVILRPRKGFGHRSIRIGDEVRPAPRKGRRHGSRCLCTRGWDFRKTLDDYGLAIVGERFSELHDHS
jgi:hypothetical protein